MTDRDAANRYDCVIVGAGHAGSACVGALRQAGFAGTIALIGDELDIPYHRPPLSKALLTGERAHDDLALRPAEFYEKQNVTLMLGVRVDNIDRPAKVLHLTDGSRVGFGDLVLATGSSNRSIPVKGVDLPGVLSLRGMEDARALKTALEKGGTMIIVGAGYIGLEVAASARKLGLNVVVVEREDRVLKRVGSVPVSEKIQAYHEGQGVRFLLNAEVAGFEGESELKAVVLKDGTHLAAESALIGIGAVANQQIAERAGLKCGNGIIVDDDTRTDDPHIYAIGDCTMRPLAALGSHGRLESVHNANEQAKRAAAAICDKPQRPVEVTWNWSDQYDLRIQSAGIAGDGLNIVVRGDKLPDPVAVFRLDANDVIIMAETINAPAEFNFSRDAIGKGLKLDPAKLRDRTVPIRECIVQSEQQTEDNLCRA
ncbi:MAG: FAD-dependent oxidoreductase [Rhodobiaceae bacterium]|nr:FAD-dependent oxidoreductase [Rhodobiaceae bacterium]MCC0057107.1 FAD-dependent oxidoreductase [Rhodobiaceae bacterium]